MTDKKPRGWYWKEHGDRYTKRSSSNIEEFIGMDTLLDLVRECENTPYKASPVWHPEPLDAKDYRQELIRRDQALIATLFLTGGRIGEVIQVRKRNFDFEENPMKVYVKGMKVLKRWKKVATHYDKETGKKTYDTVPMEATRGTFSIDRDEPLFPYMESWVKEADDCLFPSPAKHRPHLSETRAYQIVTTIGDRVGVELWNHWFRSQRASHLAVKYRFSLQALADYFKWEKVDTARIYTKLDPSVYDELFDAAKQRESDAETLRRILKENRKLQADILALREGLPPLQGEASG